MKRAQAIIRPDFLEPLKDAVLASQIGGMTVSSVHGCGNQSGWKEYFRGNEVIMNILPKIKCEFVVSDDMVEDVIDIVCRTCRTGQVGDGKIFVSPVEEAVRIRTGERGDSAL